MEFLLPLGISFYTFQSMGYLIDVYRGRAAAQHSLPRFALFVSYFPQMIQGPINRYGALSKELFAPHAWDYARVKSGCCAFCGLLQKAGGGGAHRYPGQPDL